MSEEKKELTKKEIYDQIEDLTNKGKTTAEIGLILKQKYGVRNVLETTGKKIGKVQAELGLKKDKLPDELLYLIKKSVKLIKHREENKKDTSAKRGYQKTVSKINRLRKYNIKRKKIDRAWRYSDDSAKLLVK